MIWVFRSTKPRFNADFLDLLLLAWALDTTGAMRFLDHIGNVGVVALGLALLARKAFWTSAVAFGLLDGTGLA